MLPEHYTRPAGLPFRGEIVPKSEAVAKFVDAGFYHLFHALVKQLGIKSQLVLAGIGKEGAR
jgi:hypothetical protein